MKTRKTVVLAFVSTQQAHATAIADLVADMKGTSYIKYRAEAAAIIGAKYKVEPHVSQLKKWMTFEKDTAAEQALSALMKHHPKRPTSSSTAPAVVVPKATLATVKAAVINAGLTKPQFDALVRQLRDSIQFV